MDINAEIVKSEPALRKSTRAAFENLTFSTIENEDAYEQPFSEKRNIRKYKSSLEILLTEWKKKYYAELIISEIHILELLDALAPEQSRRHGESAKKDLMGELLNTIIGTYLLQIEPVVKHFIISVPQATVLSDSHRPPLLRHRYIVDDKYPIEITLIEG
ncbi:hypothetical protein [Chitinivibrio alkaliphilus]|uniref:Uncharacterized protein n=1 Tax=Chitinivibrio alkaliphilus ACht1 TaxID=1313304 RepID=U7D886_9BACT|nr:hypothetical protein [Chitinivibrio alkaliphilus]ERP32153.1 hypothetical protein CALK_0882 [Chitinivibrio alkaliphilus ACht1]